MKLWALNPLLPRLTIELDEILFAFYLANDPSKQPEDVGNELALYRKAPPAKKAELLVPVLADQQASLAFAEDFFSRVTLQKSKDGETADPRPAFRLNCDFLTRKIEALRNGNDAPIPFKPTSPQPVEAVSPETQEYYSTVNADLFHQLRSTVGLGDFDPPGPDSDWPKKTVRTRRTRADIVLKPHDELEYSPTMGEEALRKWQERMSQEVTRLGDEAADVLDILTITWLDQAKDPKDRVWVKADDILRMRGLKPRRKGGYKQEDKARMGQHIARLSHLWVRVFEADRVETVTTPAGKEKDVMKRGRVDNGTGFIESAPFVVTSRAGQQVLFGEPEYIAWRIQLGDVLAPFFLGSGRQVARLSAKALEYNPFKQKVEKRLTRYFSWQWRIRATAGDMTRPFKVKTLVEEVGRELNRNRQNPNRPVERLEKALDVLTADGVITAWQYQDGFDVPYTEKGYYEKWLAASVIVEPPQVFLDHAEQLQAPKKKALPVPKADRDKVKAFDPARLKLARQVRGLTQLQAAETIQGILAQRGAKVKLSRPYYSMLEAGKKTPTDTLKKILVDWSEV